MPDHRSHKGPTRPPAKTLVRFHAGQVGDDTVRSYLTDGFSLAICCRECPRVVEWTPPELAEKFAKHLDLRIADLVPLLACIGEEGCGSHDIAVFPHFYDQAWTWPPAED